MEHWTALCYEIRTKLALVSLYHKCVQLQLPRLFAQLLMWKIAFKSECLSSTVTPGCEVPTLTVDEQNESKNQS